MDYNELFLDKYRELENMLKHRLYQNSHASSTVYSYVHELYMSHSEKDHQRGEILDSIRELRNQMSHKNSYNIFKINKETIKFLDEEIDRISNPINAYDICVKLENIHYANLNSKIINIMSSMLKFGYSHIPVLDEDAKLIGVFSENTIFSIYNQDKEVLQKEELNLNNIKDYLKLNNHQTECFGIVSKNTLASVIVKRFQKRKENNKRIAIIFVTENGNINEKLLGLITPYDALLKSF